MMIRPCVTVSWLPLAMATVVYAGATVTLRPQGAATSYAPGSVVMMDVLLTQDPGGAPRGLRLAQFDFTDTDPALRLGTATPPPRITWEWGCVVCIMPYFNDRELPRVAIAYTATNYPNNDPKCPTCFDPDKGTEPWNWRMLVLPPEGDFHIATVRVVLPEALGSYSIDATNRDNALQDDGAIVAFGFGLDPADPQIWWRADDVADYGEAISDGPELHDGRGVFFDNGRGAFGFVPEPGTAMLMLVGVVALWRRRVL